MWGNSLGTRLRETLDVKRCSMIREPVEKLVWSLQCYSNNLAQLVWCLYCYSTYMLSQSKKVAANHSLLCPVHGDGNSITFLDRESTVRSTVCEQYKPLNDISHKSKSMTTPMLLSDLSPDNATKRQNYIDSMNQGIQHCCAKFTHAIGGGITSLNFI